MRKLALALTAAAAAVLMAGTAWAGEGLPSAKTAVIIIPDALVVDEVSPGADGTNVGSFAATLLLTKIKTGQKDLLLSLSVECGLFTKTLSKSKGGTKDTSTVTAEVRLSIKVDGVLAVPGEVTFCKRSQELSATFQGIFQIGEEIEGFILTEENSGGSDDGLVDSFYTDENDCKEAGDAILTTDENTCAEITVVGTCLFQDPVTGEIFLDVDCLAEEEIELVLESLNANSFQFIKANVSSGVHTVEVFARIDISGTKELGSFEGKALVGRGALVVQEVRMIKDQDGVCEDPTATDPDCFD